MASVTAEEIKSELETFNITYNDDTVDKSKFLILFFYIV